MCKIKALFISPAAQAYGSERSLLGALDGIERIHVEVACPLGGELATALQMRGIRVYGMEFNKYSFTQRPDWHARFFLHLNQTLRSSRPEVVVINLGAHTPIISLACMLRSIPLVRFQRFEFRPPRRYIDSFCLRKADAIICPSKYVQHTLQAWLPKHSTHRVHHLYNPQPVTNFDPDAKVKMRQCLSLNGKHLIGYFGRLHPQKRVESLLEALPLVRASFPAAHAIIVGDHDGSVYGLSHSAQLRQLADRPGCAGAVSFLGYRSDILALMATCSMTVLPSETESFGRVLAESWSVAVPTIATDIMACREITEDSTGGLLFSVGDHEELANRITQLLADPVLARRFGESGRDWVACECDPSAYSLKLEEILVSVVERTRA